MAALKNSTKCFLNSKTIIKTVNLMIFYRNKTIKKQTLYNIDTKTIAKYREGKKITILKSPLEQHLSLTR